jgi:hypothetical protein
LGVSGTLAPTPTQAQLKARLGLLEVSNSAVLRDLPLNQV